MATLTGFVPVSVVATDNVGVTSLKISFWNASLGQAVVLGSVANSGNLNVNWDTRTLPPAIYDVYAEAQDAVGNSKQIKISVTVVAAPKTMLVSDIVLKGSMRGRKTKITGSVFLLDSAGVPIARASVKVRWSLPGGTTRTQTVNTNAKGMAKVTASGTPGTFTLTVTSVSKAGYAFDTAGSVLVKSISQ